jgi:hypothetical protein
MIALSNASHHPLSGRHQARISLARRSGQRDDATTHEVGNLIRRVAVFA